MPLKTMNGSWSRIGFGLLLGCLLVVAIQNCEAQNLVPNHSFEERDSCLEVNTWYFPETGPLGWFSAGGTGDYYMSCLPYGAFNGVPLSAWAYQEAQDGDAFIGVGTYHQIGDYREYFAVELTTPLVQGQTYYASFYASASWNGYEPNSQVWLASSGIGMRFALQAEQWEFGEVLPSPGNFAQVHYPWVLSDTVNWVLVSGSFVAENAYRYLVVGNHFDNAHTDTLHFANYAQYARAHTLIDNICVSPNPVGCPLVNGLAEVGKLGMILFPNPAQDMLTLSGTMPGAILRVFDASGREVWKQSCMRTECTFNARNWSRGMYVLRVQDATQDRSFKFVLVD